jgi:hypothetical protein
MLPAAQSGARGTMKPIKGTPRFNLKLRGVNHQVLWFLWAELGQGSLERVTRFLALRGCG